MQIRTRGEANQPTYAKESPNGELTGSDLATNAILNATTNPTPMELHRTVQDLNTTDQPQTVASSNILGTSTPRGRSRGRGRGRGASSTRRCRKEDTATLVNDPGVLTLLAFAPVSNAEFPLQQQSGGSSTTAQVKEKPARKRNADQDGDESEFGVSDISEPEEDGDSEEDYIEGDEDADMVQSTAPIPARTPRRRRRGEDSPTVGTPTDVNRTEDADEDPADYSNHPGLLELRLKITEALEKYVLVDLTQSLLETNRANEPASQTSSPRERRGRPAKGGKRGKAVDELTETEARDGPSVDVGMQNVFNVAAAAAASSEAPDEIAGMKRRAGEDASQTPKIPRTESELSGEPKIWKVDMEAGRYKCFLPLCNKDFLNVQGLRYHATKHVHEVLDFLSWAYPREQDTELGNTSESNSSTIVHEPGFAIPAASETSSQTNPELDKSRNSIRPDILALYDQLPFDAWPLAIEEYEALIPGIAKPSKNTFLIGYGKEREVAERRRLKALHDQQVKEAKQRAREEKKKGKDDEAKRNPRSSVPGTPKSTPSKPRRPVDRNAMSVVPLPTLVAADGDGNGSYTVSDCVHPRLEDFEAVPIAVGPSEAVSYFPVQSACMVSNGNESTSSWSQPVNLFSSCALPDVGTKKRKRFVLNAGGSIWGLDWCPMRGEKDGTQYLAVAGYKSTIDEHHVIGVRQQPAGDNMKGCIQIWNMGNLNDAKKNVGGDQQPSLVLCLLHDFGCVFDVKWAPWGFFEKKDQQTNPGEIRRLGLLAATFGDGSMRVFNIPHPQELSRRFQVENGPLFVKARNPLLEVALPDTMLWKVAWGGCDRIATGCTNGSVAVWSLDQAVYSRQPQAKQGDANDHEDPLLYFPAHDSCVRDLCWTGSRLHAGPKSIPTTLLTTGNDGRLLVRDIRDPLMAGTLYRIRAFMTCTTWIPSISGLVFTDSDNGARFLRPGDEDPKGRSRADDEESGGMHFVQKTTGIAMHRACVWSADVSPYFDFLATGSADGTVKISNLKRMNQRSFKPTQINLYRLQWDFQTQVYKFVENTKPEELAQMVPRGSESILTMFYPPEVAIQKVVWNPNRCAASWIASGGTGGIVRVETTFGM
ncbi:hypothetical protein SpCBS45565_g01527 [Spizellomyces sp. 'palustris']|nr:hypothetical protein SpCBS45565_g01527 [Spizellomyces sp. 'palustris']